MPPVSREWLAEQMKSADPAQQLYPFLLRTVPLGRELIQHAYTAAKFETGIKMGSGPWEAGAQFDALVEALVQATAFFYPLNMSLMSQPQSGTAMDTGAGPGSQGIEEKGERLPPSGIIVLCDVGQSDQAQVTAEAEGTKSGSVAGENSDGSKFVDFSPYDLCQFANRQTHRFESFWQAVDEYYAKIEMRKTVDEVSARQAAAWRKVDKVKESQANRIEELRAKEEQDRRRGEMLELRSEEVESLLTSIRAGLARGMDWDSLRELIDEAAKSGDELAAMVVNLDLAQNSITIALEEEDDEATEEELTRPATLVKLDVRLSAHANARAFYAQTKAAAAKTAKTIAAAEGAVKSAESKASASVAAIKVRASIRAVRETFWYEKFTWFISSENFLVLTGQDGMQADMLVKKHLGPADVFVHADVEGALPCIVKAHGSRTTEIPPLTLSQAGSFVLCRSPAWTSRNITSAWWVRHEQVLKVPPAGDRPPPGHFIVTGHKQFLPPSQLLMGFGILFKVPTHRVAAHLKERRVRSELRATSDDGAPRVLSDAPRNEGGGEEAAGSDSDDSSRDADLSVLSLGPGGKMRVGLVSKRSNGGGALRTSEAAFGREVSSTKDAQGQGDADLASFDTTEAGSAEDASAWQGRGRKATSSDDVLSKMKEGDRGAKRLSGKSSSTDVPPSDAAGKLKRGQRAKLKKIKSKYADQDDDDRTMMLELLGSAGKSKQEIAREARQREIEEKEARDAAREQRHRDNLERMAKRQAERGEAVRKGQGHAADEDAVDQTHDDTIEGDSTTGDTELQALLAEPTIQGLDAEQRTKIALHDTLTAMPEDEEELLYAVPVCAPYSVLANYKFRVKLTPGNQKKGKAARQSTGMFCSPAFKATTRQAELIRAMTDDELVRQMIPNVKIVASGTKVAASKPEKKVRARREGD